ncbi:MAG: aliphatic nitrilase [Flavobacteriaceae bacterium]|nr:MAG: aliphatic nitrilase [Flavobacteriaceae bacterium]
MFEYPKFKAAAVQTSPVFLNVDATVGKACGIIEEVAKNGASIVAFPEVFISGYPYWNWIMNPIEGSKYFEILYKNSIVIPGPEVDKLCETAKANNCHVVIGCNERSALSSGTLYNSNLIIDNKGKLLSVHRKLVPTWAEKLTWAGGDGSSLKVHQTDIGGLGTLACGENTNTLARFALLSQGEMVHVANYISLPVAPEDYNMANAIRLRASAHSFEGKLFTIVSCSTISEEIIQFFEKEGWGIRKQFERKNSAFTGIIGPTGEVVGEPLIDEEGIVYADIDLNKCIQPKQMHDIVGHYNRFDIFSFKVNTKKQQAIELFEEDFKQDDLLNNLDSN